MRVLISGAGIAGPTLAYWLARHGFTPTLVEKAPQLRTGGYIVDFWGAGFDIAERMGLLPDISRRGYRVRDVRVVNRRSERVAGFPVEAFARATGGRYVSLPRGELAAAIFRAIEDKIETIFGNNVTGITQSRETVQVTFERGGARDFDLVVGADGLHSRIRDLMFGPQRQFEKYLGYIVAAFEIDGYRPRDELVYVMYSEVGQQVSRFAMRGDRTMFLFIMADENPAAPGDTQAQKAFLRKRFGHSGWECPQILDALDGATELYFDRLSQIRMNPGSGSWSRGRVTLIGDAASCVSFLAGEGSGLAMVAAYILAGELHCAGGDHARAFARYETLFGPFALGKQRAALRFAGAFAPQSRLTLFLRNQILKTLAVRWIADLAVGRSFNDDIALGEY